jgi:hypothetical protein
MARTNLRLVASQSPSDLMALREAEARAACFTVMVAPCLESWFAWLAALERLEAERLRSLRPGVR